MTDYRVMPPAGELPRALYRAAQVRELDRIAIEEDAIPGAELMARAGRAAFDLLRERWPDARDITVVVGTGNNGGDGFVVAELARVLGLSVRVLQVGDSERLRGDALLHAERDRAAHGSWKVFDSLPAQTDVIVDAVFGTGLEREVTGRWAEVIQAINDHPAPVLAIDVPSGLHSDTGCVLGSTVQAAATISFIGLKQGLFTGDGPTCSGTVYFDALAVPARVYARQILSARRLDGDVLATMLPPRPRNAHKGDFGHVLVVGGDHGLGGAARLAAEAAARVGAGLVSLATRAEHVTAVLAERPEIMVRAVARAADLDALVARASVIALGPGLGRGEWGHSMWERLQKVDRPLVVDADGLNWLANQPFRRDDWVLTPHPGEAARLLGCESTAQVQADRFAALAQLTARFGGAVVLKGAGTLIGAADASARPPAVCTAGNPGMASGGMGDVLTGVVAGLIAQGHSGREAAELGVCVHARAADLAATTGERGLLARDLLACLRRTVNP